MKKLVINFKYGTKDSAIKLFQEGIEKFTEMSLRRRNCFK